MNPLFPLPSPAPAISPARRLPAEDRRRQIILSAIEVFAKDGFRGATTKHIAEAAGVSEAIIFRHFATKQDLYAAILDFKEQENGKERWMEELQILSTRADDEAFFNAVVAGLLGAHRRDPLFRRLMIYAALEGQEFSRMLHGRRWPVYELVRSYIVRRQKAGALRKIDPELMVMALIAMPSHFGLVTQVFGFDCVAATQEEIARAFTQILMDGVRKISKNSSAPIPFRSVRSVRSDVHVENR